eukprot:scaffold77244_cov18-Tisochrysis_lutea.AAC.2
MQLDLPQFQQCCNLAHLHSNVVCSMLKEFDFRQTDLPGLLKALIQCTPILHVLQKDGTEAASPRQLPAAELLQKQLPELYLRGLLRGSLLPFPLQLQRLPQPAA